MTPIPTDALADMIRKAVAVLGAAGHPVETLDGDEPRYRIDGCDPVTGPHLLSVAIRLGLFDEPARVRRPWRS